MISDSVLGLIFSLSFESSQCQLPSKQNRSDEKAVYLWQQICEVEVAIVGAKSIHVSWTKNKRNTQGLEDKAAIKIKSF